LNYMHAEQLLMTMKEDPDWIKDMITTLTENMIVMSELMLNNGFRFDAAFIYNDMGYKNGLLFSPDSYQKTHYEADRLLYAYFHSKGLKTILHSCGNVTDLIPVFIDTGLDCLQPLKVKAGMDIIQLKKQYGDRLAFMGGIDTRIMAEEDPAKIEEEIKNKFGVIKKNGGYIYHSDHSIPKNVSFEQYCRVMELIKKYGVYPEYEELQKQEETPAAPEKSVAVAEQTTEKKPKRKLFGKKNVEEKTKPNPQENPQKTAGQGKETQKKKKFKLPFGKK